MAHIKSLQEKEKDYKEQIERVHLAMKEMAQQTQKQLNEKNECILSQEEFIETYRERISQLEEEIASQFYN